MAKSVAVTYLLWAVGGWFGLHHLYLGRDNHALVWVLTLGGCCGAGWVRDLFCLSDYVDDANDRRYVVDELRHLIKMGASPQFHIYRFSGELIVGILVGCVVRSAIPEAIVESHRYVDLFIPLVVALGVWLVGCIGHERISLKLSIIGAYAGLPMYLNDPSNFTYMALISSVLANSKGKSWHLNRRKRNVKTRICIMTFSVLLYATLWGSALYHNGSVTTGYGEKVKISEAFTHFYNSPAWEETKGTLMRLWKELWNNGPRGFWDELVLAIDPEGEVHAYRVLGLGSGATEKEITTAYRQFVREWHPDKHTDKHQKEIAAAKFLQIQQAYETLSEIKTQRAQRNSKQRSSDDEL